MFEDTKISLLFYIIILVLAFFVLAAFIGYMMWEYHIGKPLAPFFWLRLKGWTNPKIALFEIFSLTNSVSLEEARKEIGDGYRLYTQSEVNVAVERKGIVSKLMGILFNKVFSSNISTNFEVKKIKRINTLIMPKSTYTINGVRTILLWDLHPQLHVDILEGLKILILKDIKTLTDLKQYVSNTHNAESMMFKNYTYRTFYELYLGVRQKYTVIVTTDDILNFIGKQFDKNFRESIEAKDYNALQKSKVEKKIIIYGYIAIIIAVVVVSIRILYNTIFK